VVVAAGAYLSSNRPVTTTGEIRSELDGVATIAGRGLAASTTLIRDVHQAIAQRVFRLTGPAATPVRVMHQGLSSGVYAAVGGGLRVTSYTAGKLAGAVAAQRNPEDYVPLADRIRGNVVIGALNGAWGDQLGEWQNPLALSMTIRAEGRDVPLDEASLDHAFPEASDDVVVFLHGLCETELSWWLGARGHHRNPRSSHGYRLMQAMGATPVYLRYNTGRHISDNGDDLAALLDRLVDLWPTAISRLTLVGHSLGGLVIRSACARGQEDDSAWVCRVRRIVYLGAPHLGAPLEVAVARAGAAMRKLPETRPVAVALASRSVGIKDLRYGDILAADWSSIEDLDAWRAEPPGCAPLLTSAEHYYIGATLTREQNHLVARLIGDSLVTFPSASGSGRSRRLEFEIDRGAHLGGLHHFDLLNHPRVWELLERWLVTDD
jgi:pimeloyl-ACP methyl ester carboxylesterase